MWNYRILKFDEDGISYYSIREVHYDQSPEPKADAWGAIGHPPGGESLEELADEFKLMQLAFQKPVLKVVEDDKLIEIDERYTGDLENGS